jgi:hypothetical protein
MAYTLFDGKLDDEESSGYTLFTGEIDAPVRRRDVTPFKVDIKQPPPVAAKPVASIPSADYTDPMGGDFGSAIMDVAEPAPPAPIRSVLNTPQAQRSFQEAQLAKPGAMLRSEYVDTVRNSFANMAPEKRLTALTEMLQGTDSQAQAAQRILADVQAEAARNQELSQGREGMIGLIANAARTPPGPKQFGTAPPEAAAIAFPDVAPKPFDTLDTLSEKERVDKALRLDEATRGVVRADTSIRAIADNIDLASRDLDAEAFAKENPILGALVSGRDKIVSGLGNAIPTIVDFAARLIDATKTDVDSTGNLALSFDTETFNDQNVRAPTYEWADRMATRAKSYMPEMGKQNLASAVAKGEFGSWFGLNLVAQAPQIAASFVGSLVPALRPFVSPAMGAQTAGSAYGEGDSSFGAVLKGVAEIGGQRATFGIFDRTYAALAKLPLSLQASTVQSVGRALAATGATVTAQSIGGAIEEVTTQIFQNGVDKFVEGKDVGLLDQVADAAVLGAAMQGALSVPHGRRAFQGGKSAFADAFAADVAGAQFDPAAIDAYARRALDVQSYDANIITPRQQAQVEKDQAELQGSTTAADAATAADNLSGSLAELLVPTTAITPLPPRIEPTGLPELTGLSELPTRVEPTGLPELLDLGLPPVDQGLPAVNPAIEQQFGLDKLRLNAPRPQNIQGKPVANLTDENLTSIVGDEAAHPITRRGAAIELTARQAEQAPSGASFVRPTMDRVLQPAVVTPSAVAFAPPRAEIPSTVPVTPAVEARVYTPAELGKLSLGQRRNLSKTFDQTENEDGTITFTAKPAPSAAPVAAATTNFGLGAAEGRVSNAPVTATGDAARADLQARLNETAAKYGITVPALTAPAKSDEAAVNVIAEALGHTGAVVAYADDNGADGFELGGKIAINTKTQKGVAATAFHENHHVIERLAEADTQAGRVNTPAQQYVVSVNGLFDDMKPEGKRSYVENFIHKDELASIADPVAREQRTQELLSAPMLRSEMSADFMGNRATDRDFLAGLAAADPEGFGGFVKKWIGILDNMLVRLRGVKGVARDKLESVKVDQYLNDLNRAKMVARDAMVAFRNGTLQQSAPATTPLTFSQRQGDLNAPPIGPTGSEILPGAPAQDRRSVDEYGGNPPPSYGTARTGAVSVVARHYSTTPRQTLSGEYYGRGLKGAERARLDSSPDPRLKNRVYFYVDTGAGVRPEAGVGGYAHEAKLDNIYDPQTRLIKPQADANAFESAVINAGFDGYIAPFGNNQSAVVLLGQKHKSVPVRAIGQPQAAALPAEAAPTTLKKGLMSAELNSIDTSTIPGARVRAGTLEIPAESRDAANAELARIGSPIQFSPKEKIAPARVMFEVAPDPDNVELKARWDALPVERQSEVSQRIALKTMPQVFKLAGVRAKVTKQLGGFLEDTSPSFAAMLPSSASAQQVLDVAHFAGFGLKQNSMMVLDSKPFEKSFLTGLITVTLPENMQDQKSVHSVYQAVRQVSPENISGHTTVGQEMVLAVPSDKLADLTSKIVGVLNARPETFGVDSAEGHMALPSKEEYDYGKQTGELSPELSAKRAEANRIREEASGALERELATYEGTGGRKIDNGVYRAVADSLGLSQAEYDASALPLMLGGTEDNTFRAPNVGGIPETVQWLDQRRLNTGLPILDINKPGDRTILAKIMAAEAVAAIRSAGNAVEWYDETIAKTLRTMAVKYPELDTDPHARNAFLIAVAISSQTMDVEANLKYASQQYEQFRKTGKFPEVGTGKSAPAMAKNFTLANDVLEDMGPELLRRFLQTEFTKRELETIGFPISGESMDETMLGSAIFGPKIGFGFYSNLTGNFEPVTMDMWFMRAVGRLAGTLPAFDPVLFPKQVAKLRAALAETGPAERGVYADQFSKEALDAAMKTDAGAIALAREINSRHNRQFIKERAAFDSGARIKTALVGASNGILKSADKPTDSPASGGERQRLRDVVRQMVAMVEKETGKRVPPAALQALIWYPEQELYKKLGVGLRVTSQDYAGAAKSLLTKEGFDGKRISTAAESGPGSARQVVGKSVSRANKKAGQPSGPTGPIQGQERETFIQARTPLEDIFAGLDKRGLTRTRAEAAFTARPDGAQIKYVQENFTDILIQLEDADKVKINCD